MLKQHFGAVEQPTYTCREGVQERQSMLSSTNNNNKIQNRRSDEFQHFETLMAYVNLFAMKKLAMFVPVVRTLCLEGSSSVLLTVEGFCFGVNLHQPHRGLLRPIAYIVWVVALGYSLGTQESGRSQ